MKNIISTMLSGTYVQPWKDKQRAYTMLSIMPGLFAASLIGITLVYNMAGYGLTVATLFHLLRMALLGVVGIPLSYWVLSKKFGRWLITLAPIAGTLLYQINPSAILTNALGFALTAAPFWAIYSYRNAIALSSDNQGNDLALLSYLQVFLGAAGVFLGGLMLDFGLYQEITLFSGLLFTFSIILLATPIPKEKRLKKAIKQIGWKKPATKISFTLALTFALVDHGLPTWMRVIGLSPLSTGITLSMRPLLGLILTPIAGHLLQKGRMGAGRMGSLLLASCWGTLFLAPTMPAFLLPALSFMTMGNSFIGPLEFGCWAKRRTNSAIIAREWVLTLGRAAAIPAVIPIAFLFPALFPALGIAGAGALYAITKKSNHRLFKGSLKDTDLAPI